ncbi:hypothetical protein SNEBB_000188 [Seison nebaliae]|nr:hypothetical protein SNEBB_000188 [Seison nebaliae]
MTSIFNLVAIANKIKRRSTLTFHFIQQRLIFPPQMAHFPRETNVWRPLKTLPRKTSYATMSRWISTDVHTTKNELSDYFFTRKKYYPTVKDQKPLTPELCQSWNKGRHRWNLNHQIDSRSNQNGGGNLRHIKSISLMNGQHFNYIDGSKRLDDNFRKMKSCEGNGKKI